MPIPEPKQGENKQHFIERCMSNPAMVKEFPDSGQRVAVCNKQWNEKKQQ